MKTIFALLLVLCCGCNGFKKIGSNLGEGFNSKTKSMGQNLVSGLQAGIADSAFRAGLYTTLDSAILVASTSTNKNLKIVLDSVLNERWSVITRQLVEDATGKQTKTNIDALRESLLGAQTKAEVAALIAAVLNDENTGKLIALRNELLGEKTNEAVAAIVDNAMLRLTTRFQSGIADTTLMKLSRFLNSDLKTGIGDNLSIIQKYATWFLVGIGVLAAFIITLVWVNRQKYLKLSTLLASQVNAIPNQQVYDQLTARIKQQATVTGVEPALQDILAKNKLLGENTWKPVQ